jgi:hypothetical protein
LTCARMILSSCYIYHFIFVRLPLCNNYSDYIVSFISIHSVIIYIVFFGTCMRCTRLCSLNPGVTPQHVVDADFAPALKCVPQNNNKKTTRVALFTKRMLKYV